MNPAYSHTGPYVNLPREVGRATLAPMTSRAEAKQQTREALLVAGMELFRDQGLDGPSLDAICERAGKTRGAFYVHFADREAFELAVLERILMAYVAIIVTSADAAGDLERTVRAFTDAVAVLTSGAAESSPIGVLGADQLRLLLQGVHRSRSVRERFRALVRGAAAQLAAVVAAGQAGGAVRDDVPPDAIALVLVSQVFGMLALVETGVPSPREVDGVRDAVLALLRPPLSP